MVQAREIIVLHDVPEAHIDLLRRLQLLHRLRGLMVILLGDVHRMVGIATGLFPSRNQNVRYKLVVLGETAASIALLIAVRRTPIYLLDRRLGI